jgi:actin-like ATPase involved in cell morphogenesis
VPLRQLAAKRKQAAAGHPESFRLFDGMLHRFLRKAHISGPLQRLKAAIAVPSGMTEVERLVVIECLQNAGAIDVR